MYSMTITVQFIMGMKTWYSSLGTLWATYSILDLVVPLQAQMACSDNGHFLCLKSKTFIGS